MTVVKHSVTVEQFIAVNDFNDDDYWRSIILYGLNQTTYKIAIFIKN